jgi:hypothetical protein
VTGFLSPVALDFLWESLDAGELPYPLDLTSHGHTLDERGQLRHRVLDELRTQHLVEHDGRMSPHVEDWLTLLARGTHSVDAVFEGRSALAAGDGTRALLATQTREGLTLTPIDQAAVVSSIVALLPPCPRGTEKSITIPAEDLHAMASGRPAGRTRADREVLGNLSDERKIRAVQLAANARNPLGGRRRSPVLSWFDTESGRYLTYTRQNWVTIAPADAPTLRHHLTELLHAVTGDRRSR